MPERRPASGGRRGDARARHRRRRASAPQRLTTELAAQADAVITMGCGDACPVIPGKKQLRADWDLPDPKERPLDEVRATRDDIDRRVRALVAELDAMAPRRL